MWPDWSFRLWQPIPFFATSNRCEFNELIRFQIWGHPKFEFVRVPPLRFQYAFNMPNIGQIEHFDRISLSSTLLILKIHVIIDQKNISHPTSNDMHTTPHLHTGLLYCIVYFIDRFQNYIYKNIKRINKIRPNRNQFIVNYKRYSIPISPVFKITTQFSFYPTLPYSYPTYSCHNSP